MTLTVRSPLTVQPHSRFGAGSQETRQIFASFHERLRELEETIRDERVDNIRDRAAQDRLLFEESLQREAAETELRAANEQIVRLQHTIHQLEQQRDQDQQIIEGYRGEVAALSLQVAAASRDVLALRNQLQATTQQLQMVQEQITHQLQQPPPQMTLQVLGQQLFDSLPEHSLARMEITFWSHMFGAAKDAINYLFKRE